MEGILESVKDLNPREQAVKGKPGFERNNWIVGEE